MLLLYAANSVYTFFKNSEMPGILSKHSWLLDHLYEMYQKWINEITIFVLIKNFETLFWRHLLPLVLNCLSRCDDPLLVVCSHCLLRGWKLLKQRPNFYGLPLKNPSNNFSWKKKVKEFNSHLLPPHLLKGVCNQIDKAVK